MSTTEPIRDKKQVFELSEYYLTRGETRNYVLITFGLYTALRISDLLRITWDDVYDFKNKNVFESICVTEKKTNKSKIIALNKGVINALSIYASSARPGVPLFLNKHTGTAISRIQAYRLIRTAAEATEIQNRISCHSLRKTFGYHAWKKGISPAIIMDIYNHSSLAVTRRYLGVTQDDKNDVYLSLDLTA